MTKGTWICFDCRLAQRHRTWKNVAAVRPDLIGDVGAGLVRCVKCRELCVFLGPAIELPSKHDEKAWLRLRTQVSKKRSATQQQEYRQSVSYRHDLEHRIRELEDRPQSVGRERLIRQLKRRLEEA